jgi:hypothetical protein
VNKYRAFNPFTYACIVVILIGFIYYQEFSHKAVTFQGTVTNQNCQGSGGIGGTITCTLSVGSKTISYQLTDAVSQENAVIPAAYYAQSMVGKKVVVHALRLSYHKYTLDPTPGYYVKLIQ